LTNVIILSLEGILGDYGATFRKKYTTKNSSCDWIHWNDRF
jgi:hypothetical protein